MREINFIVILLLLINLSANAQREEWSLDGTWKFKVDKQSVGLTGNWKKSIPDDACEVKVPFKNLIDYGQKHINDDIKLDYFEISLPDLLIWEENLNARNTIHCTYLIGLGKLGLQDIDSTVAAYNKVIDQDLYHLPAVIHRNIANDLNLQLQKS